MLALAAGVFLRRARKHGRAGAQYIQAGGQERQKESADLSIPSAQLEHVRLWLNPFDGFAIEDYASIKSARGVCFSC